MAKLLTHPPASSAAYGFIGVGEITAAIVEGLSAGIADPPDVFLSPRNPDVALGLSRRFPKVRVCANNQAVLEHARLVVLAVRPDVAVTVLKELSFQPRHVLISAVAGVRLEQLRSMAAPAGQVVRAIPLPQAVHRQSLTAMYPESRIARDLFARVGEVVEAVEESTLEAFSAATATFAAYLDYLTTIANWLADRGVDSEVATTYVTHIFGQLGQALSQRPASFTALTDKHMTSGGLNEQFLADLRREGMPAMVRNGLDRILTRLRE